MKYYLFALITLVFLAISCSKSRTNEGKDFIGIWESNDTLKLRIEIEKLVREGREIEHRYDLKILEPNKKLPRNYIKAGQYNYQLVTADPSDNYHPFQEFIHKNSMADTMAYLGLKEENKTLIRRFRYKDLKDITFKKIE